MEERQFDNRSRFNGISELYHAVRPHFPQEALRLLKYYTGKSVQCTIDLGCGTGLSTRALLELSETVIGIDPNADMLARARSYRLLSSVSLDEARHGYSRNMQGFAAGWCFRSC